MPGNQEIYCSLYNDTLLSPRELKLFYNLLCKEFALIVFRCIYLFWLNSVHKYSSAHRPHVMRAMTKALNMDECPERSLQTTWPWDCCCYKIGEVCDVSSDPLRLLLSLESSGLSALWLPTLYTPNNDLKVIVYALEELREPRHHWKNRQQKFYPMHWARREQWGSEGLERGNQGRILAGEDSVEAWRTHRNDHTWN